MSALNHTFHKFEDNFSLRKSLSRAGIDPNGIFDYANYDESHKIMINSVSALNELESEIRNRYTVFLEDIFRVAGDGSEIIGGTQMIADGKYAIYISKSLVVSNFQYASVIGHEMYHVYDMMSRELSFHSFLNPSKIDLYEEEIRTYKNFNVVNKIPNAKAIINYYKSLIIQQQNSK